jgi:hypothetical protein
MRVYCYCIFPKHICNALILKIVCQARLIVRARKIRDMRDANIMLVGIVRCPNGGIKYLLHCPVLS